MRVSVSTARVRSRTLNALVAMRVKLSTARRPRPAPPNNIESPR
jgi:hypothetical protein